ncbi:adenylate/guanylate cyclase domain-containing protein [uncultured Pseudomonas sp.]|uniref:adenylate/guanylate cyclase domain-containing protein n=1 Tax=uncultured Pseudomonas sp. TaxID=114707 RepID=UPI00258F9F57|nr:adenylate/guanylate cyclase domain-containing protein [uncultured Pseudomonas sp.]
MKFALNRFLAASGDSLGVYYARVFAYLIAAASVTAGYYTQADAVGLWLIPYALLYPHVAQTLSLKLRRDRGAQTDIILAALDAIHVGMAAVVLRFPLMPTLMLLFMLGYTSMLRGGPRLLGLCLLFATSAAALGSATFLQGVDLTSPLLVAVTSVVGTMLHLWGTGYFLHRQRKRLIQINDDLKREQEKSAILAHNLAKYLSPQVWESIFTGKQHIALGTQRKKITVFFSDIKGFTELSEELEAEALTDMLNNYLNEMSKIAVKYGGTIDKFVGDCVMVFFGDANSQGAKKDAVAAVSMAIAMRKHMKVLRQQWRSQGINKPLEIRMGLNTGYCTVGNFGSSTRMDYTIIGREVNLASRLENAADAGEILISHETYSLVKETIMCRDKSWITVKGFSKPVQIYQVVDFRRDLGASPSYVEHELPGFSMYLDTNNIQNYDKERVIQALQLAAEKLKDKVIL